MPEPLSTDDVFDSRPFYTFVAHSAHFLIVTLVVIICQNTNFKKVYTFVSKCPKKTNKKCTQRARIVAESRAVARPCSYDLFIDGDSVDVYRSDGLNMVARGASRVPT